MEPLLDDLIGKFRTAQDAAVAILIDVARLPWPESNRQWSLECYDACRQALLPPGVELEPHGYGVEVIADDLLIDFDWGDHGEADGFDGWRLYNFAAQNFPELECSHTQLNELLAAASVEGSLIRDRLLFYDAQRRAMR